MEVTPLEPRGVTVLSGDGAKPHGRDTSQPAANKTQDAQTSRQAFVKPEPTDADVDRMATALSRVLPHLDPEMAKVIATNVLRALTPDPIVHDEVAPRGKNVDVSA